MPTAPERVRRALLKVTGAARTELQAVVQAAPKDPQQLRAALFATAPLIVSEYTPGASTLALDWYDEIRTEAKPRRHYTPTPRLLVTNEDVAATVARATADLRFVRDETERIVAEAVAKLEVEMEKQIAASFRDTIIGNTKDDPASVGWRRFARPEACKFCLMLADRGAVYTKATARFAAHGAEMSGGRKGGNCMCIAGPAFGGKEIWAEATPMQYVASSKRPRNPQKLAERNAKIRDYLNQHFPDAHG